MQFNSYNFILLLLPISVIGYYMVNKYINVRLGNVFLLLCSLVFYSVVGWKSIIILLGGICINYMFAVFIRKYEKNKLLLTIAIVLNISLLFYFKYCNFFISNFNAVFDAGIEFQQIILPLGISFYTFQQIAYLVSTYRKELIKHSLLEYIIYITYFPKIIMGPLIEPNEFIMQLQDDNIKKINLKHLVVGIQMFTLGLFKKVLIADTFAKAVNWGFSNQAVATSADWLLIMVFYSFQIYFDFSGYSDMAIAVSKMLNIDLPLNFNSPYKAYSLRDFWKRWHISLTNFLTKYIYIPLGGNRKGSVRLYLNMFIVFLVSGIWHGANWTFILWGVLHGTICVLERFFDGKMEKIHYGFRWAYTFVLISVLWLLFRAENVTQWIEILKSIVSMNNTSISSDLINIFALREFDYFGSVLNLIAYLREAIRGFEMFFFLVISFLIVLLFENNCKKTYKQNIWTVITTVILLSWSIVSLSGEQIFVYFGF